MRIEDLDKELTKLFAKQDREVNRDPESARVDFTDYQALFVRESISKIPDPLDGFRFKHSRLQGAVEEINKPELRGLSEKNSRDHLLTLTALAEMMTYDLAIELDSAMRVESDKVLPPNLKQLVSEMKEDPVYEGKTAYDIGRVLRKELTWGQLKNLNQSPVGISSEISCLQPRYPLRRKVRVR